MKKVLSILMIAFTALSCLFLASCKSPFDKIKLEILSQDDSVVLVLDGETQSGLKNLQVKITNPTQNISSEIDVFSEPRELLAENLSISYAENIATVQLKANNSGSGQLIVALKDNNQKRIQMELVVQSRIQAFSVKNEQLLLAIPQTSSVQYILSNSLLNLTPADTTDIINWTLVGELPDGVTFEDNRLDISSEVADNTTATFYPSVVETDYTPENINDDNEDKTIVVNFCKILQSQELALQSTTHGLGENNLLTQSLILLTNKGEKQTGEYYNEADINLMKKTLVAIGEDDEEDEYSYADIDANFSIRAVSSDSNVIRVEKLDNNSFRIKAVQKTSATRNYYITFYVSRAGFEDLLEPVSIVLPFVVTTMVDNFAMTVDGNAVSIENNVVDFELYDIYKNANGAVFKFETTPIDSLKNFLNYTIRLDSRFLHIENNVYTDNTFVTLAEITNTNQYQLMIVYKGVYLKFYQDGSYLVSQPISNNETISIRYNTISGATSFDEPVIYLKNYIKPSDTQDFGYFSDLEANLTVNFDILKGVKTIDVSPTPSNEENVFVAELNSTSEQQYFELDLYDNFDNLLNSDVVMNISSNSENCLIAQKIGSTINYSQSFVWDINQTDQKIYYMCDEIGDYIININHNNGTSKNIAVKCYRPLTDVDLDILNVVDNANLHLYEDDDYDYYVHLATNSAINIDLTCLPVDATFESASFEINSEMKNDGDTTLANQIASNFVDSSVSNKYKPNIYAKNLGTRYTIIDDETQSVSYDDYFVFATLKLTYNYYENETVGDETNYFVEKTGEISFTFKIFIFVPVQNIVISQTYASVKSYSSLSYYDKDSSKLDLTVSVYPQTALAYLDNQTADNTDLQYNNVLSRDGKFVWKSYKNSYAQTTSGVGSYLFDLNEGQDSGQTMIFVNAHQYNRYYYKQCTVYIEKSIKVEKMVVSTNLRTFSNGRSYLYFTELDIGNKTINLNISVFPQNAFDKSLRYIVYGENGSIQDGNAIVSVANGVVSPLSTGKARILIVPNDSLIDSVPINFVDENNLSFIAEGSDYRIIDIIVAAGSYENPFFISTVNDLLSINTEQGLTKHYALINDINLPATSSNFMIGKVGTSIVAFTGSIRSYYIDEDNKPIFAINGLRINSTVKVSENGTNTYYAGFVLKLQKSLNTSDPDYAYTGTLEGLSLNLSINFTDTKAFGTVDTAENYFVGGLVAKNYGSITNCFASINISEIDIVKKATFSYIGGLVGYNEGNISITNKSKIGVSGSLSVVDNVNVDNKSSQTYIGGVVGQNNGTITGSVDVDEDLSLGQTFVRASFEDSGAISSLDLSLVSTKPTLFEAVGGVVGYNVGQIDNVYSTGHIIGTYNVGGIIGKNIFTPQVTSDIVNLINTSTSTIAIEKDKYQITESYTSASVQGIQNVGGVVGLDKNGSYYYVNCEMYSSIKDSESAYIEGNNYVGGFAGRINESQGVYNEAGSFFLYCFVVSYRSDYTQPDPYANSVYKADILISNTNENVDNYHVGGFAGYGNNLQMVGCSSSTKVTTQISNYAATSKIYVGQFFGGMHEARIMYAYTKGRIEIIDSVTTNYVVSELSAVNPNLSYNDLKNYISYIYSVNSYDLTAGATIQNLLGTNPSLSKGYTTTQMITASFYENSNIWNISLSDNDFFGINADINSGYPYIKKPNNDDESIVIEVPLSIEIQVNVQSDDVKSRLIDVSTSETKSIILFMYQLTELLSGDTNASLSLDNLKINTINLTDFITYTIMPESTRLSRLSVASSNNSVVEVNNRGEIILKKVGSSTLTISSVLDPNQNDSIVIYVVNGINIRENTDGSVGSDGFNLYYSADISNEAYKVNNKYLRIQVGEGLRLNEKFSDIITVGNNRYRYAVNTNTAVSYTLNNQSLTENFIEINGQYFINEGTKSDILVVKGNRYDITALLKTSENLSIIASPKLIYNDNQYIDLSTVFAEISGANDLNKTFTVITRKGAQDISTSVQEMTLTANGSQDLSIYIDTDEDNISQLSVKLNGQIFNYLANLHSVLNFDSELPSFDSENDILKLDINISVKDVYIDQNYTYTLEFIANGHTETLLINIVPEDILNIRAINYLTQEVQNPTDNSNLDEDYFFTESESDKILPGDSYGSVLKLVVSPENAYYDYIKVESLNTQYPALFSQVYKTNISGLGDVTHYKTNIGQNIGGLNYIVLNKMTNTSGDNDNPSINESTRIPEYYIRISIDSTVNNQNYQLKITPYRTIAGIDTAITGGTTITIQAVLLPQVIMNYSAPNNETIVNTTQTIPLAYKSDALLLINATNTDGAVPTFKVYKDDSEIAMANDIITVSDLYGNGKYYLQYLSNEATNPIINHTLRVVVTVKNVINGIEKFASDEIRFVVRTAVIHSVSVKNVYNGTFSATYGDNTQLEAYFDENDISYYNGSINETVYDSNYEYDEQTQFIKTILDSINSNYAFWKYKTNNTYYTIEPNTETNGLNFIREDGNLYLKAVNNRSNDDKIQLSFKVYYAIETSEYPLLNIGATTSTDALLQTEFILSFASPSSLYSAIPVYSSEQFLAMLPNRHYILLEDIELSDYNPLDIELASFDGNGHTITIENFDLNTPFVQEDIIDELYLSLFKQIYTDMIVQNVVLNVPTGSAINLSNIDGLGKYAETIYYGGITNLNYGIITNCIVKAPNVDKTKEYLTYSSTESENLYHINNTLQLNISRLPSDELPTMEVGGLATQNLATGYITNSKVMYSISANGDIAGVVCANRGNISSTKFIGGEVRNNNSDTGESFKTAGFAISNSGTIKMCYAEGTRVLNEASNLNYDQLRSSKGGIRSSGYCAGFVYANNSIITDCYADMNMTSNGYISGFVFENAGTMNNCVSFSRFAKSEFYTPITGIDESSRLPLNTGSITNCLYLKGNLGGTVVSPGREITLDKMTANTAANLTSTFINYIFDDSNTAVWKFSSFNSLSRPNLVSCNVANNPTRVLSYTESNETSGTTSYYYAGNSNNALGTSLNPYIIYDAISYNTYFDVTEDVLTGSYRIVRNIDLLELQDNPVTSSKKFIGEIEGNGMKIYNVTISTSQQAQNLGLFSEIGSGGLIQTPFVRNLEIVCTELNASNVTNVGVLAGTLDKGNVFNININNNDLTVIGKNVVGGVFGLMKGKFKANGLYSNVNANSGYRLVSALKYNLYYKDIYGENLTDISYAGCIAGIVDNSESNSTIRTMKVTGSHTVLGETVGTYFGLLGQNMIIDGIIYELMPQTSYKAKFVAGGIVGENRGVIKNTTIKYSSEITTAINNLEEGESVDSITDANTTAFSQNTKITGGLVGVNISVSTSTGIIDNCYSFVNVINNFAMGVAGGLVGRNVNGYIKNSEATGMVFGKFAGGLLGTETGIDQYKSGEISSTSARVFVGSTTRTGVAYYNCSALNKWESKYLPEIVDLSTLRYSRVLGGIIGAVQINMADITTLFSLCEYNNAYKHAVSVESTSPFANGYFGLNPVAIVNATIDNWTAQNGYNGLTILSYDVSNVDALQRTNMTDFGNGVTLNNVGTYTYSITETDIEIDNAFVTTTDNDIVYTKSDNTVTITNLPVMARLTIVITSDHLFSVSDQNAISNGDDSYSLTLYIYAFTNNVNPS